MLSNPLLLLFGSLILLPSGIAAQDAGRERGPGSFEKRAAPEAYGRNILILVADDLGVDMLAAYGEGNDLPRTPNLDEFARTGVLFRNAWSQPTCSPTRATLHTGLGGYSTGIGTVIPTQQYGHDLDLNLTTLPKMLDIGTSNGYAHAAIGKWHVSNHSSGNHAPNIAGYEHFSGTMGGQVGDYFAYFKIVNGAEFPVFEYATSAVVDDSLEWIAQQTKPWMCYVAFQAPTLRSTARPTTCSPRRSRRAIRARRVEPPRAPIPGPSSRPWSRPWTPKSDVSSRVCRIRSWRTLR